MSKEDYRSNRQRVFELYGIDPSDPNYNCHHIVFRSDFREPNRFPEGYCDSKANLIPLPVNEHKRLHERVEDIDQGPRVLYQASRKEQTKYRLHDLGRLLREGRFG